MEGFSGAGGGWEGGGPGRAARPTPHQAALSPPANPTPGNHPFLRTTVRPQPRKNNPINTAPPKTPPPPPPRRYELLIPKRTSLRHRVPLGDEGFVDFLSYLLTPDPGERPTAEEALAHPWLRAPYPPAEAAAE